MSGLRKWGTSRLSPVCPRGKRLRVKVVDLWASPSKRREGSWLCWHSLVGLASHTHLAEERGLGHYKGSSSLTGRLARCLREQLATNVVDASLLFSLLGRTGHTARKICDGDFDASALYCLEVEIRVISRTCARPVGNVQVRGRQPFHLQIHRCVLVREQ